MSFQSDSLGNSLLAYSYFSCRLQISLVYMALQCSKNHLFSSYKNYSQVYSSLCVTNHFISLQLCLISDKHLSIFCTGQKDLLLAWHPLQ